MVKGRIKNGQNTEYTEDPIGDNLFIKSTGIIHQSTKVICRFRLLSLLSSDNKFRFPVFILFLFQNMQRFSDLQITDKLIKSVSLAPGHYEYSAFTRCDFSGMDLRGFSFTECDFNDCDLSNANIHGVQFREVVFDGCKMLGLDFEHCGAHGLDFKVADCLLNYCNFTGCNLKKKKFNRCHLIQADFTHADLTEVIFDSCDLSQTVFFKTLLEGANMVSSFHYSFDLSQNRVKGMKVSMEGCLAFTRVFGVEVV